MVVLWKVHKFGSGGFLIVNLHWKFTMLEVLFNRKYTWYKSTDLKLSQIY